jgi:hypothetical protein
MTSPAPAYDYSPRSAFTVDWNQSMATQEIQQGKKEKKDVSQHPDILSPGLEVYGNEGMEVVPQPVEQIHEKEKPYPDHDAKYPVHPEEDTKRKRKRICGIGLPLFFGFLALLVIIAIALGVGLGVGLSKNKKRCVK